MTVLNFVLADEAIYLVGDTIVSDPQDMSPVLFTTKIYPVPHLQGLICGTGIMQFIVEWYCTVVSSLLAKDLKQLDEFIPDQLRNIFQRHQAQCAREVTSTIYHFGFDEGESRFIGFAYRSTNNFRSEQLPEGTGIKPNNIDVKDFVVRNFPDDFINLAKQQKAADEDSALNERVGIGGKLIAYSMHRHEIPSGKTFPVLTCYTCHQFDDYDSAYSLACAKLPANKSGL